MTQTTPNHPCFYVLGLPSSLHVFGTAEATVFKFSTQVGYSKCYPWVLDSSQIGVVRVTWLTFKFWGPYHISETGEARHFKFNVGIDHGKY